jgi:Ca2+-transporting ATPase
MNRPDASSSPGIADPAADPSLVDAAEVASSLGVDPASGLSSAEAAERLANVGPNRLDPAAQVPAWRKLLAQFADPLIYLLLAAIVISVVAWALEGAQGVPFEAIVIAVIVIANAVLGFVQERKAEQAVAALQRMAAPTATVVRDGQQVRIPAEELVPGDLLVLGEGDAVGADGRLVWGASLQVAESSLTGESEPVLKDSSTMPAPAPLGDRTNMAFSGTAVTRGRGRAVVTATGMGTEMGRIAALLGRTAEERTPLQREVDLVGRMLGLAVIVIAVVVVAAILVTSDIQDAGDLVQVLLLGVSLAVAAVPEGLPAVLSVVLALGVQRMAAKHAIVKKLSSVETLGSASVICSDKTGTLTRNEMTIQRVVTRSGEVAVTGIGYRPEGELLVGDRALSDGPLAEEVRAVVGGGSLANVLGTPIGFPASEQGSAAGAALLGHVALGHLTSVDDAAALVRVTEVVHPGRDAACFYRRLLPAFARTAEAVEDLNAWRADEAPDDLTHAATGQASKEELP